MFKEYAVEPAAIAQSWEVFRYLIEKFGFSEGRLISRFPNRWESEVIQAAVDAGIPDVARKRLVEKLRLKKPALLKSGRNYDPDLGAWVDNALASSGVRPFHAIITKDENDHQSAVCAHEVDDRQPLMIAPRSLNIPQTASDISEAFIFLLANSKEIDLVDPYFYGLQSAQTKYRNTLAELLKQLSDSGVRNRTINIHYKMMDQSPPENFVEQNAGKWLEPLIPDTFGVHLHAWEEIPGGERFHDRFALTDRGGVQLGAGFAALGAQASLLVTILDEDHAASIRSRYASGAGVYNRSGAVISVSSDGSTNRV